MLPFRLTYHIFNISGFMVFAALFYARVMRIPLVLSVSFMAL